MFQFTQRLRGKKNKTLKEAQRLQFQIRRQTLNVWPLEILHTPESCCGLNPNISGHSGDSKTGNVTWACVSGKVKSFFGSFVSLKTGQGRQWSCSWSWGCAAPAMAEQSWGHRHIGRAAPAGTSRAHYVTGAWTVKCSHSQVESTSRELRLFEQMKTSNWE